MKHKNSNNSGAWIGVWTAIGAAVFASTNQPVWLAVGVAMEQHLVGRNQKIKNISNVKFYFKR